MFLQWYDFDRCDTRSNNSFNTSLLIPILKKGELRSPSDYRPISMSTSTATLFEVLLLDKIPWI